MIHNIQHLRGLAALLVVLFHSIGIGLSYGFNNGIITHFEGFGGFGVDIFFVISGFIMMHIQSRSPKTTYGFIKSRAIRIIPLYWLLSSMIFLILILFPQVFREPSLNPLHFLESLAFISQISNGNHPILYVGWTLEWEMLFYLVFALSLTLKEKFFSLIFTFLVLSVIAISFDQLIVFEFILGMLASLLYDKKILNYKHGVVLFTIGCMLFMFWFLLKDFFENVDRLFTWGIPAFFIVLGALHAKEIKSQLASLLGDASYSIYLVQVFTIPVVFKFFQLFIPNLNTDLAILISIIFSGLIGTVTYLVIEKPMTAKLRKLS
jgi:exopolysaccharide production protein ExoZ